jgi:Protein of unknown function (DUF3617)
MHNHLRTVLIPTLLAAAPLASAQVLKPGLWEMTTTMTVQQAPSSTSPAGASTGANSALKGAPRTMQVCLTQEEIDKFHSLTPQTPGCQLKNVIKNAASMTADMVCTGVTIGRSTVENLWTDDAHEKSSVHFVRYMQTGGGAKPIEWSAVSNSIFKGPDCGDVKPFHTPLTSPAFTSPERPENSPPRRP